jgi:hypothetical protein
VGGARYIGGSLTQTFHINLGIRKFSLCPPLVYITLHRLYTGAGCTVDTYSGSFGALFLPCRAYTNLLKGCTVRYAWQGINTTCKYMYCMCRYTVGSVELKAESIVLVITALKKHEISLTLYCESANF